MTLIQHEGNCLQRKADLWNQFRLHTTLWCSMIDVQCTKDPYAGVRYYKRNFSFHVQVSGVGKRHLKVSSNRFGQLDLKLQKSAMNLSGVDAQNDALVGAGVKSLHFHAHLVMGNATKTRQAKRWLAVLFQPTARDVFLMGHSSPCCASTCWLMIRYWMVPIFDYKIAATYSMSLLDSETPKMRI